jgi:hypothetical protein
MPIDMNSKYRSIAIVPSGQTVGIKLSYQLITSCREARKA